MDDREARLHLHPLFFAGQPNRAEDIVLLLRGLARYDSRLATAAVCVANGEANRFTGVMCESYHDVWMELHEDLIVLQRIDRTAEGSF